MVRISLFGLSVLPLSRTLADMTRAILPVLEICFFGAVVGLTVVSIFCAVLMIQRCKDTTNFRHDAQIAKKNIRLCLSMSKIDEPNAMELAPIAEARMLFEA
jgi:hypothetical protein